MVLEGVVTNVAAFGAFVDIGVHQDGLVHVSALSKTFVKDPHDVVKSGDIVRVKVLEVDIPRKRIGLTLRLDDEPGAPATGNRGGSNGGGGRGERAERGDRGGNRNGGGGNRGGNPKRGNGNSGGGGGNRDRRNDSGGGGGMANNAMAEALRRAGLDKLR
jgi:uncharacterized protein